MIVGKQNPILGEKPSTLTNLAIVVDSKFLILKRHALTTWNLEGRFQGRTDVAPLPSEIAKIQPFSSHHFTVFSSPLGRAKISARAYCPKSKINLRPELIEMDYGNWEGKTKADVAPVMETYGKDFWGGVDFNPHQGETLRDLIQRLQYWLRREEFQKMNLIFCHKTVLMAFNCIATGWRIDQKPISRWDWNLFHVVKWEKDSLSEHLVNQQFLDIVKFLQEK